MTRPAAVLFDCDGVVVDSEPATFALLLEDFAARGLILSHSEAERLFLGGTIARCGEIAATMGARIPPDWTDRFYEALYTRLAAGTPLIPGITGVLDALGQAGVPFAIGSNGTARKMQVTLGQHPEVLRHFAGRLFSGQDLGMLKPAPELYLHAAGALGVAPQDCVVIEDSAPGARAARRAGMRCLGYVPGGDGSALVAEGAQPFSAMADLVALLRL